MTFCPLQSLIIMLDMERCSIEIWRLLETPTKQRNKAFRKELLRLLKRAADLLEKANALQTLGYK